MENDEHDWFSVAEEQLLVAIELYRSGSSYYSALTLSGNIRDFPITRKTGRPKDK